MPEVSLLRRAITSPTLALRSPRGFKLMRKRPLLIVTLLPSTPMNEDRL